MDYLTFVFRGYRYDDVFPVLRSGCDGIRNSARQSKVSELTRRLCGEISLGKGQTRGRKADGQELGMLRKNG
jgi:hypothetical protein